METSEIQRRIADAVFTVIENDPTVKAILDNPGPESMEYKDFLYKVKITLSALNSNIHEYMARDLNADAGMDEWRELYILARHIDAMVDAINIYKRHAYPPF